MSLSANTPGRVIFQAGTVTIGAVDVGATMEGNVFRWEMDTAQPHFHGARGPVTELMFVYRFVAYLEVVVAELVGSNFAHAFPGLDLVSDVSSETISGWDVGCLDSADYADVVLTVTKCTGFTQVLTLYDAIVVEASEITFHDEGDPARMRLVFMATYDPADPDRAPFSIVNNIA